MDGVMTGPRSAEPAGVAAARRRFRALRFGLFVILLGSLLLSLIRAQRLRHRGAELVLRGGAIYTVDAARSWASALAITEGRIVYVGTDAGVAAWIGQRTQVLELAGRMVLPGFTDAHLHPVEGGVELGRCALHDRDTPQRILDAVRTCAEKDRTKPWVLGSGVDLLAFPEGNPDRRLLDAIVPERPVYFEASDGHSGWVNSRALAIAGISRTTPDPPGGRIERDPETGEPSGTLREAAMDLVANKLAPVPLAESTDGLRRALAMAARFGITTLMEANASEEELAAYADLDRRGELTARVIAALEVHPERGVAQVTTLAAQRKRYEGRRLRASAAKLFADGVMESRTAALLAPYVGSGGDRGKPALAPELFDRLVVALDREGFQVHVHAVGDRAVRMSLDAFERARAENGVRDSRHHIAHLQLIDPQDIPRFRRLGVIANFQPLWAQPDPYAKDYGEAALGTERSRWLYPIQSVLKTGAVVVYGSDWSVTSMNPLLGMQVAVTRRDPALGTGPALVPEEAVDLAAVLAAYTINGAYLSGQEGETGSLEAGKAADLVVLDRNLFELSPGELRTAKVLLTLLAGREVYRDPECPRSSR